MLTCKFILLTACAAVNAAHPHDSQKGHVDTSTADIFALRQSFHYSLSDDQAALQVYNHDPQAVGPWGNSVSPASSTLMLRAQNADIGRKKPRPDKNVEQHVLASTIRSYVQDAPLEPNVTDRATVINLAKMTDDAYYSDPSVPGWLNLTDGFNRSQSFGWKEDGLRGHVFANADNSTVVIAFKGTTINPLESSRSKDLENDNLLFSCCCAAQRKGAYWYGPVCDCKNSTFSCNQTCLSAECRRKDRYYAKAKEVVLNVSSNYPHARLWMVGHSMGGAIASLMGMTFHTPAVTFEAVPERLPAQRLDLQLAGDDYFPAYHFGNTADPVYMGACNGYTASCSAAGYAFESQCFTGKRCIYDTMGDKGWHLSILNHPIVTVISQVLEKYENVPTCEPDDECQLDCFNWSFFDDTRH